MRLPRLFLLMTIVAAAPAAARAQPADGAAVEDIVFTGVQSIDAALLRAAIETRESACASPFYALFCLGDADWAERRAYLDTAALRRDEDAIRRTYATWGFPSATVRGTAQPLADGDVRVRFDVAEGAPVRVRTVVLRGTESLPALTAASLPVQPGDVYALPRIQAAQRAVARRFGELGHAFVQVEAPPQPIEGGLADVVIEVTPGPLAVFGPTTVTAEAPLQGDAVRRRLPWRAGQRFSPDLLDHAVERLYDLPIVDSVEIRPAAVTWSDSVVETFIAAGTGKAGVYEIEGVVGSSRCVGAQGMVSHRHAFGAPRVLTLSAGASNLLASELCGRGETGEFTEPAYTARVSLAQPVGRSSWLLLEGAVLREAALGAYVRRGWQARVGWARELARSVRGTLAFAPERGDNGAARAFLCALYGECAGAGGADAYTLAPVEARLDWAPVNARAALGPPPPGPAWLAPERPRWVPSLSLSVAAAAEQTGSDHAFARAVLEGSATRLVGARVQVGARARLGVLAGGGQPLPPQLRLFGGGPGGVRGVPANLLGPRILIARDTSFLCYDPDVCAFVGPSDVYLRAAGGDLLAEASVEARIWATRGIQLAAFVDAGAVHTRGGLENSPLGSRTESIVTPGVGVLALTPAGPIRVDVAYDPSPARRYPLLARREDGGYRLVGNALYDPVGYDDADAWTRFRRRLQLQLSMGAPF